MFFVGMAGDGTNPVFTREVDSVAKLMKDRFGAEGHVIKLENGPGTAETNPVASLTSLRAALKRVAAQMDIEEDVLVLFLTSHGSTDFQFSLQLWPLDFKRLDPAALRQALDESGIRNRIVVISACYSGGFVDKLRDDHTVVITAAAKDRNSFGCDSMADWTYFGRAYFDEALRQTHSFTKAFDIARPLIEQREQAEKFDPSMPQISVGAAAQAKVDALAAQLDAKPSQ
ncbi:MAG TPA: C13 family peptidase [Usitatibacter sp.]|nr:C13 family peptidase [Usitatibacter sp.]